MADADVPALLRRAGWSAHAACFPAGGALNVTAPNVVPAVVVPNDPALARAAPRRIAAFLAGRYCAARALAASGHPAAALPVGEAGAPAWPAGVVGSISHAPARAVAVVAHADRWRALGVDCEAVIDAEQADEVAALTLPEADAAELVGDGPAGDGPAGDGPAGDGALTWPEFVTVGFSAKESLYKCLRPLVGAFFDFADARLTHLDRAACRVRLCLARDLAPEFARGTAFDVGFALADGHVYTCLALPRALGPTAPECAP